MSEEKTMWRGDPWDLGRPPTTPGPWEVVWSSNTSRPMEILGPDRRKIVRWGGLGEPASIEAVGNAKLIASAPEQQAKIEALADALEGVVRAQETGAIALWREEDFAILRAALRIAGRRGAGSVRAECGAIGERWICIKPAGHCGLHVYERRNPPKGTP